MIEYKRATEVHSPAEKWALKKVVYDRGERLFALALTGPAWLGDGSNGSGGG